MNTYFYCLMMLPEHDPECFSDWISEPDGTIHAGTFGHYRAVASGSVDGETPEDSLDELFFDYNQRVGAAEGWEGRSLSVSDLVRLEEIGSDAPPTFWLCQRVGWKQVSVPG